MRGRAVIKKVGLLSVAVAISAFLSMMAYGASVYVYTDAEGNRLITDHKGGAPAGYRLLRKYQADDYFGTAIRPGNWKNQTEATGVRLRSTDCSDIQGTRS